MPILKRKPFFNTGASMSGLELSRDRSSVPPSGSPPRLAAIVLMLVPGSGLILSFRSFSRGIEMVRNPLGQGNLCDCPELPAIARNDRNDGLSRCITFMMTTVHLPADQGRHEPYCEYVLVN